jgi:hypothetical protein
LVNLVRRLRGQVDPIECTRWRSALLGPAPARHRGAQRDQRDDGGVLEEHVREYLSSADVDVDLLKAEAAEELIEIIRSDLT